MRPFARTALLACLLGLLAACGAQPPSPADADVQALTLDICGDLLRDQLIQLEGPAHTGMAIETMQAYNGIAPTYAAWKAHRGELAAIGSAVDAVDAAMRETKLSLSAVRMLSRNAETGLTRFAAELDAGHGTTISIKASAQYTEDEQLYVEVAFDE